MPFECRNCAECCKRYYITLLPGEAAKQSEFLGIPLKEFVSRHTQLYVQFFPFPFSKKKLLIHRRMVPKKFISKIDAQLGEMHEHFLVLPSIALKKNGVCAFLEGKKCLIHEVKPAQCGLFPFIFMEPGKDLLELYPFCLGLKEGGKRENALQESRAHYLKIKDYFDSVREKGFTSLWKEIPDDGIAALDSKLLGGISKKEFFKLIAPYK